jgi:dTDP-4-amino-4,6-dideoxygalactose transaminase
MKVPFLNLKKINRTYSKELKQVASEVIDSGYYLRGDKTQQFEDKLSHCIKTPYAIAVGNGLDALTLILRGYKELGVLQEGDEVVVPANTYIATIISIIENGLHPVLVEPDPLTFNLDPDLLERTITPKTKAIMVVHLYGRVCWSREIEQLATKYNLKIIEDNAQAFGAEWCEQKTGSLGHASGFSFYPGKNLGALGDAGAVTTSDSELTEIIRSMANYGSSKKYVHNYIGVNSRIDEIQATFLSVKLKHIKRENQKRRDIAEYYQKNICNENILLPSLPEEKKEHVWHLYVIRSSNRNALQSYLKSNGIETLIHYPIPPHKQQAYQQYRKGHALSLPITDMLHQEVLSLPIWPGMKIKEMEWVVESVNQFNP